MEKDHPAIVLPPPPERFTLDEWYLSNRFRCRCSEAQQELAERLVSESTNICNSSIEAIKANKKETDHRIEEKLGDIQIIKEELLQTRKDVLLEIDALSTAKDRVNDAISSIKKNAFIICQKCLITREQRLGVDLVYDDVEVELLKECQVIARSENLLVKVLEQIKEQIRRIKAILYSMDHDIEAKDNNLKIDKQNLLLRETSLNLSLYYGNEPLELSTITLDEWEMQSQKNIEFATREMNGARPLRCYIDQILEQIIKDLNAQKDATDNAFQSRVDETKEAKTKLELQHSEVVRQVDELKLNIIKIEKTIAEKESFLALAHTRLGNRCQRPGLELTHDLVEINLMREVQTLREMVVRLQRSFLEAQASLRYLLKTQIDLEEDINIKINSLKIDQVDCMTLRQSMNYHAY
ncbi:tektin-1 [Venturia canescens]|uniref:tektin-1 n=1 Tax=Venturia canescens TaxID=32260 RepID=UPI001C9BF195|nr:tektin-1 [Venturia canescens]